MHKTLIKQWLIGEPVVKKISRNKIYHFSLDIIIMFYYLHCMAIEIEKFFLEPKQRKHILYEALRKSFVEKLADKEICHIYQINFNTFRSLKQDFKRMINSDQDAAALFFSPSTVGKREKHDPELVQKIIALRVNNLSVPDIKATLASQGIAISFWKIDKILKAHHFPALSRRNQQSRQQITVPQDFEIPEASQLDFPLIEKFESMNGSIFLFYPILKSLHITKIINEANYPETKQINRLSAILSFLALKLINTKRLSHSNDYSFDRGLGLFAGLNVLPKNAWVNSYCYRVDRTMNTRFLKALNKQVEKLIPAHGDFNLDFTTIPHWGDNSVLERNWSGTRHVSLKSVLALLVQQPESKLLKYSNAEIKHVDMADAILEFIDFYKSDTAQINCLIFDSKFTTYSQLNSLNKDGIKFLTLRRRSSKMIAAVEAAAKDQWQRIQLGKNIRRKYRNLLVLESTIKLKNYDGSLRQIVVKNNGRKQPAFIVTNDFDISIKQAVLKYARRWLVEQAISEQVEFYHLNRLNSSIVVKVDFDLTMSVFADTVYKLFTQQIPGFENCKSETIYRSFIKNYTHFNINIEPEKIINITLNKKVHLPLLYETGWFNQTTKIEWLDNYKIKFEIGSSL